MKGSFRLAVVLSVLFAVHSLPSGLHAENLFRRGDVDDSGGINLGDPIHLLGALFRTPGLPLVCGDAADADDNGKLELTDAVYLLNFLFLRGTPPPPPFPACGKDPTRDIVSCSPRTVRCRNELLDPLFDRLNGPDAFVFVIDRSGSMQDSFDVGLGFAKSETIRRIESFSEDEEFAIIFFDRGLLEYPEDGIPVRATPEQKDAASSWIASVPGGGGTCPQEALSAALTSLGQSAAAAKRIIYIGDGGATCAGVNEQEMMARTLDAVAAQNTEGNIIHAAYIGETHPVQRDFLQRLVDANSGILVEVNL